MIKTRVIPIVLLVCMLSGTAIAKPDHQPATNQLPRVSLFEVLDAVSKNSGLVFVVDKKVSSEIVVGGLHAQSIDYPTLLVVLRNNEMAAVEYEGVISIVDVSAIRQYPLPVIYELDAAIPDEQWVTMLVRVQHANATMFVPIMRPMLPQQGHMVAHPESNSLTIVDRYGNIKRVLELIKAMDVEVAQP